MMANAAASFELQGLPNRDAFIDSALAFLSRLFPGDGVAWNAVDMQAGKVELRGTPPKIYNNPSWARRMEQFSGDHPMVRSYLSVVPTVQALPRRLSDVATRDDDRVVLTGSTDHYGISQRELEVLQKLANGHPAVAIGRLLRISPSTVRKHLQHVYDKTGARDRLQAVSLARRNGLISTGQMYRA